MRTTVFVLLLCSPALLMLACGESDQSPQTPPTEEPAPAPKEEQPPKENVTPPPTKAPYGWNPEDRCAQPKDEPVADAVPDFRLRDANKDSGTARTCVSPRDYLGSVSAWYWGHTG